MLHVKLEIIHQFYCRIKLNYMMTDFFGFVDEVSLSEATNIYSRAQIKPKEKLLKITTACFFGYNVTFI